MDRQNGFTVLEIIIAIVVIVAAGAFFYLQKRDLVTANLDTQRKTAVNSIYYNLENIYFPANNAYPETLTVEQLTGLDPSLLTDPSGKEISQQGSSIRYEPTNCNVDGKCRHYTLTALLDNEADFVKVNAH